MIIYFLFRFVSQKLSIYCVLCICRVYALSILCHARGASHAVLLPASSLQLCLSSVCVCSVHGPSTSVVLNLISPCISAPSLSCFFTLLSLSYFRLIFSPSSSCLPFPLRAHFSPTHPSPHSTTCAPCASVHFRATRTMREGVTRTVRDTLTW